MITLTNVHTKRLDFIMKKGEKTRNLILEKSLNLFSENGYAGSSIRQIASGVGIRESAIYNHFKSKNDIFLAIIAKFKQGSTGINILSDELLEDLEKPDKFMRRFSEELLHQWGKDEEIKFMKLIIKEQGRIIDGEKLSIARFVNEARKVWEMIFSEMVKHSFIKKNDPVILANEFISSLFFIRLEFLLDENNILLKEAVKRANSHVDFFWTTIKK